jgi:hypothetical protein
LSDHNDFKLAQPDSFTDSLTDILREGARALLAQAIEAEVADFLAQHATLKTANGLQRLVRHGHLPEREVLTGIGPVGVRQPRVRDRQAAPAERVRFRSSILPPYARRSALEEPGGAHPDPVPQRHLHRRLCRDLSKRASWANHRIPRSIRVAQASA